MITLVSILTRVMITARISSALVLAMAFYRRNLPHWHPEGASIFLTWRLYGSLPVDARSTARIGCATRSSWQSTAVEERKGKSAAVPENPLIRLEGHSGWWILYWTGPTKALCGSKIRALPDV